MVLYSVSDPHRRKKYLRLPNTAGGFIAQIILPMYIVNAKVLMVLFTATPALLTRLVAMLS